MGFCFVFSIFTTSKQCDHHHYLLPERYHHPEKTRHTCWPCNMWLCVWLLSLSIMFSRFSQVILCITTAFLFMAEQHSTLFLSSHQLVNIWVVSETMNNVFMYTFFNECVFSILLGIHLGVELLSHDISTFNILRTH